MLNNPEEIRAYVEAGLEKFVKAVVEHKPQAGELRSQKDYDNIRIMVKCCVEKWIEASEDHIPVEIQDAVFNIGLVGHYCTDGLFRVVENYYASFIDSQAVGVKPKLLSLLLTMRRNILDRIMEEKTNPTAKALLNPNDIHLKNEVIPELYWLAGEPLTFGAQANRGDKLSWLGVAFNHAYYQPMKKRRLHYTPQAICEALNEDLSNGTNAIIPFGEYSKWFGHWFAEKHKETQIEGEARFTTEFVELVELGDSNNPDYRYSIKEGALLMMLVEMGILKVPNNSPYLQKT